MASIKTFNSDGRWGNRKDLTPKKHTMHTAWGVFWWTWGAWVMVMLLFDSVFPEWWWLPTFGAFLIPEIIGAAVKNRKGDTFSQSLWTLSQHGIALRLFAVGMGWALTSKAWTLHWLLADMLGSGFVAWYNIIAWSAYCLGMGVWLTIHFLHLGKKG